MLLTEKTRPIPKISNSGSDKTGEIVKNRVNRLNLKSSRWERSKKSELEKENDQEMTSGDNNES